MIPFLYRQFYIFKHFIEMWREKNKCESDYKLFPNAFTFMNAHKCRYVRDVQYRTRILKSFKARPLNDGVEVLIKRMPLLDFK